MAVSLKCGLFSYGQFALSLGKENPYIFSKFNPLNTDTSLLRTVCCVPGERKPLLFSKFNPLNTDNSLIRALSMTPSVSVLTEFDCIYKTEKLKDTQKKCVVNL